VSWFEAPREALANPVRFLAYAMTYASHPDMRVIRSYVSDDDFRRALDDAPSGIIDPRSWAYWNAKLGRYPPPPPPQRDLKKLLGPRPSRDPEDIRRSAREEWLAKYGPKNRDGRGS